MAIRGIRGATVVSKDDPLEVISQTRQLLEAIQKANSDLHPQDIASIFFSVTEDITSAFPAKAARELGWLKVPLMCFREIPVPASLPLCIRVLVHWNTEHDQQDIHPVYMGKAKSLRPDFEANEL